MLFEMDLSHLKSEFLPRTLNPFSPYLQFPSFHNSTNLKFQSQRRRHFAILSFSPNPKPISTQFPIFGHNPLCHPIDNVCTRDFRSYAGRSKKTGGSGSSSGRIEGNAEFRRRLKRNARVKSKKLAESLFYRLKNPKGRGNYPDNFSEDLLQQIGLGYDRMVRFMEKDDPNLRHPYDWYKYGQYGPYSWRGVVVGEPVSGGITDECVTIISEVKDHEEWEEIEKSEMASDFGKKVKELDQTKLRYFWVFIRHPKWRVSELPWQQWTLVSEVVLEAGKQRLDKWNLMGRLGNKARSLVAQCAAWLRPDVVYVKRPVFQCRFEPQDNFFREIIPFLDPSSEQDFLFELENDNGSVELCTYYGGLCKIVKVSQKAFVDDVVNAFQKLSDEKKSKCLEFLLTNHPVPLLHPYTKEWKDKLDEMELGCDAPDEDGDEFAGDNETEILDWIEDEGGDADADIDDDDDDDDDDDYDEEEEEEEEEIDDYDGDEDQDLALDLEESADGKFRSREEDEKDWKKEYKKATNSAEAIENLARKSVEVSTKLYKKQMMNEEEEDEKDWKKEYKKATNSAEAIENLARKSVEVSTKLYKKQMMNEEAEEVTAQSVDGDETVLRGKRAKVSPEEWKIVGFGPWRKKIKKSKLPPELFLQAAVRPFTYRNLVKEIVLTRHAILDGDIGRKV